MIHLLFKYPYLEILSIYLLKMDFCDLGTGYSFTWCVLVACFSSLYIGLVFQVPKFLSKRK